MKYEDLLNSLYGRGLREQKQVVLQYLLKNGFVKVKMNSSRAYNVYAYTKCDNDYAIVEILSKNDELKNSLCIINYEDFEMLKTLYFRNNLRGKNGCKGYARIQVSGYYEGKHLSGANVCEMVCAKTSGQVIDHKFHNTMINTKEAVRACTVKENNMNKKTCKNPTDPIYAYKPEEDFSDTWYVYIFWRVLGLVSQEEAFEYNIEKNK